MLPLYHGCPTDNDDDNDNDGEDDGDDEDECIEVLVVLVSYLLPCLPLYNLGGLTRSLLSWWVSDPHGYNEDHSINVPLWLHGPAYAMCTSQ